MPVDAPAFDLQSHSTQSDGSLAPAEVVAHAGAAGVELLALTDHDTVAGAPEALAAARTRHPPVARGRALERPRRARGPARARLRARPLAPRLLAALEDFRADRVRRIHAMADRLRELGFALDDSAFAARESLGRPHLADAVLAHPDNAERLAREGIRGKKELFPPYLVPGAAAYVARSRPTVGEAIEVIHAAGGVAVWAHPFWDIADPEHVLATVRHFAARGLDGVECFYAGHSAEQALLLHDECETRELLSTGSADFHGPDHEHFHRFRAFDLHGRTPRLGPIGAG